jgi:2-polyprenyl-6-methoxyphenol hydroxylase-like FAD-dependent oxidoreductase
MPNNSNTSVLIAGGGPTGLAAALELRRFGIPVRIVDEMEGPTETSRAIAIQARTLEELELRGLADEFVRIGHRADGGDIYGGGRLLVHADFTKLPSRYNFVLFLAQTETDRILREALEAHGGSVEWAVKMKAFGQDPSGVTATLEHADGSLEEVNAAYMIDAEGAHSIIRSTLGLQFKGKTLDETFVLGDGHSTAAFLAQTSTFSLRNRVCSPCFPWAAATSGLSQTILCASLRNRKSPRLKNCKPPTISDRTFRQGCSS